MYSSHRTVWVMSFACVCFFFYLYEGRLASISLVLWAAAPLSDESCESSLSESRALKEEGGLIKCTMSNCIKWHIEGL